MSRPKVFVSRRIPVNTQMGMGHERYDPALGGWASDSGFSELNHRRFYQRWAEVMAAERWSGLAPRPISAVAAEG